MRHPPFSPLFQPYCSKKKRGGGRGGKGGGKREGFYPFFLFFRITELGKEGGGKNPPTQSFPTTIFSQLTRANKKGGEKGGRATRGGRSRETNSRRFSFHTFFSLSYNSKLWNGPKRKEGGGRV